MTAYVAAYGLPSASFGRSTSGPEHSLTSDDMKVGPVGLEPTTYGLKVRSSAN